MLEQILKYNQLIITQCKTKMGSNKEKSKYKISLWLQHVIVFIFITWMISVYSYIYIYIYIIIRLDEIQLRLVWCIQRIPCKLQTCDLINTRLCQSTPVNICYVLINKSQSAIKTMILPENGITVTKCSQEQMKKLTVFFLWQKTL